MLIMTTGMSYMLIQFINMSSMTTEIIDRYQPVTNITSMALKHTQSSVNLLHEHLLNYNPDKIHQQRENMAYLKDEIIVLIDYTNREELNLDKNKLLNTINVINEIETLTNEIETLSNNYDQNHPVIAYATESLNPIGLEYLGYINQIIDEADELELSTNELVLFSNMRHSWSQVMGHMRTVITSRNQASISNIYTYINVNLGQYEILKRINPDIGIYSLEKLKTLRDQYTAKLEQIRDKLESDIWRSDTKIMIDQIMPLYDQLKKTLNEILRTEIKSTEKANADLSNRIENINYMYTLLILSGVSVAFIISVFITRSLRKPLQQLAKATKDVASGKFETHINVNNNDEISQLANSFNKMVNTLKQSQQELLEAKDHAENANQSKTQFLRSMSHELRTPMNAVLGYSQLLTMESSLTDDQRESVNEILRSGNHLLNLINQVLDLARIESGNITSTPKTIELSGLITSCLPIFNNKTTSHHNIKIINNIPQKQLNVFTDELNLKQIIINLVTNAIKYNKENGNIIINAEKLDNKMVKVSISDTGIGLTEEEIKTIFDPFQRLSFLNSSIEGSGIGLTITKQLIEAMQGEIGIDSIKDIGSTFWFTLPLAEGGLHPRETSAETHHIIHNDSFSSSYTYAIVYIEDNIDNFKLMKTIIDKRKGISITHAETAEQGLETIKMITPDLVLMDISLPGINGYEALKLIKSNKNTSHIPVIAVSAHALTDDVTAGLNFGFDDYITKPIDINRFNSIIDHYIPSVIIKKTINQS
ncbi:MAG: ATP-binding protein [Gammaproteobacteria bacterium]|nr:ATP-binding protein [Gammaproteobacteria bacterium]